MLLRIFCPKVLSSIKGNGYFLIWRHNWKSKVKNTKKREKTGSYKRSKPSVNFINIIRTNFSYKRHFSSYVLALLKNLYEKHGHIMLMKLTTSLNDEVEKRLKLTFTRQKKTIKYILKNLLGFNRGPKLIWLYTLNWFFELRNKSNKQN